MIAIDENFRISETGGTGNATIFVNATTENPFSTASTQIEVSSSVGNIKRYVTLNKKAAHGYMYTPVEWVSNEDIESRIWIDLGYVWKNNSRAQLGFVIPGTHTKPNGQQVFGEDTVWASDGNGPLDDTNDLRLFFTKTGSNIGAYWDVASARVQATVGAITDVWQDWEIGNNYIKNLSSNTNIVTGSTYSISRTGTVGLYGACQYLNTGRTDCVRYSYIKIYEGDTLVRDVIPVLDKDNIPCFFDKLSETFYYYKVNDVPSTGLTAGNAYQQLEYLQGDGTDYIITDYTATSNTRIEVDCSGRPASTPSSTEGEGTPMGCEKWNGTQPSSAQGGMSIVFPGGGTGGVRFYYGNTNYDNNTSQKVIERGIFKLDGNAAYIDDFKVADITTSFVTQGAPFALFNSLIYNSRNGTTFPITNVYSGAYYEGKIYGVKIYENNVLVRDYVPCAGTSTRGFYDRISGNYLTSVNGSLITGTVIGDLVIPVIYSESDIVISNDTPSTAITTTFNLNASTTPTGATLTYSSSDTSIATVDSNGVITAVAEGTATITITAQAFQDNTNHIYYNATSKTVSIEATPPAYMYTPVEWISNEDINSRIWIDLGYTWTNTSKAEIGMIIPTGSTANGTEIFGEWFDWQYRSNQYEPVDDANDLRMFFDGSNCYCDLPGNSRRQLAYEKGKAIIWQFGNQYLNNVNQKTTNTGTTTDFGTRTSTVGLFGAPASGGYTHKARFYYVKIWEGDTLVRDIIPVLDSNNIPCFFDKVNANFHYYEVNGQPSTGLTAGGAIAEYSYIDNGGVTSSYNCYIPINYVWKTNSRAVMSLKVQSAQSGHLFSDEDGSNRLRLYPNSYGQFQMEYRGTTISSSSRSWSNVQNIEMGNYYIKDTDTGTDIATGATKTVNQTSYCFLFGYSDKIQYYSVKIYEGDTLVCDLVPAMANNGYKGLWDKKRCQFFFDRNNQNSRLYVGTKVDDIVVIGS